MKWNRNISNSFPTRLLDFSMVCCISRVFRTLVVRLKQTIAFSRVLLAGTILPFSRTTSRRSCEGPALYYISSSYTMEPSFPCRQLAVKIAGWAAPVIRRARVRQLEAVAWNCAQLNPAWRNTRTSPANAGNLRSMWVPEYLVCRL